MAVKEPCTIGPGSLPEFFLHHPNTYLCCLQSSAVETQTARVQLLKTQAATGKVSVDKLEQQQSVLSKMTVSAFFPRGCACAHCSVTIQGTCSTTAILIQ